MERDICVVTTQVDDCQRFLLMDRMVTGLTTVGRTVCQIGWNYLPLKTGTILVLVALLSAGLPLDPAPTLILNLVLDIFPLVPVLPPFLMLALVILASSLILGLLLHLISDATQRVELWAARDLQGLTFISGFLIKP